SVRETSRDAAVFSSPLSNHLLEAWRNAGREAQGAATPKITFSERQAEVLQLIAEGYLTKQIAGMLCIGAKTVQKHRQNVMEKLKLHKIAALTRYAVATGIIESNREPEWDVKQPRSHLGATESQELLM